MLNVKICWCMFKVNNIICTLHKQSLNLLILLCWHRNWFIKHTFSMVTLSWYCIVMHIIKTQVLPQVKDKIMESEHFLIAETQGQWDISTYDHTCVSTAKQDLDWNAPSPAAKLYTFIHIQNMWDKYLVEIWDKFHYRDISMVPYWTWLKKQAWIKIVSH